MASSSLVILNPTKLDILSSVPRSDDLAMHNFDRRTSAPVRFTDILDNELFMHLWHWLSDTTEQSVEPPNADVAFLQTFISTKNEHNA